MAEDLDDEQLGEEQREEEATPERIKRIFINHVDSFHGKHIARIFARAKPGTTKDSVEEESVEEENSDEKKKRLYDSMPTEDGWKVSGTIQDNQNYNRAPFVQEIIQYKDRNQLIDYLKEMDTIIYDITQDPEQIDEAVWSCQKLESIVDELDHQITFILLSTVMTWTKTQPSEDEGPFTDEDYRRRRAHPNFKEHHSAEKIVLKAGLRNKKKLLTQVVATGLTYGMEENIFHYMFKSAWQNSPEIQVFGKGSNVIPTIHVIDLAAVLQNLADRQLKVRYVIAADMSRETLMRITRKVSQTLSTGKVKIVDQEEAMLNRDITQADYDMLLANLQFDPVFIRDQMNIRWHCENGILENIQKLIEEYRNQRNLTPIKICVLGPPASGKTTIAKQLAEEYNLPHLQIKEVLEKIRSDLEPLVKRENESDRAGGEEALEEEEEMDEAFTERLEEARVFLDKFDEIQREDKDGRLSDEIVTQIFKLKLTSAPCQNQGYVLDGYPKSFDQAVALFGATGDEEEEEGEDKKPPVNERIIPNCVVILEANDEFLRTRIENLPERSVVGTHNTQTEFARRIAAYREKTDDGQPEKFFEDVDRPGEIFKIDEDRSVHHRSIVEKVIGRVKEPHNYGPTNEEQEVNKRKEIFLKEKNLREENEERQRQEKERADDRMKKQNEWTSKLKEIKHEEYEMLEAQQTPLRNYLMSYVMPTLTKSLIECCQTRPEDPIDFVAEFLFKNNSQV